MLLGEQFVMHAEVDVAALGFECSSLGENGLNEHSDIKTNGEGQYQQNT